MVSLTAFFTWLLITVSFGLLILMLCQPFTDIYLGMTFGGWLGIQIRELGSMWNNNNKNHC